MALSQQIIIIKLKNIFLTDAEVPGRVKEKNIYCYMLFFFSY